MLFNYDISLILIAIIIACTTFYVSFWLCKNGVSKNNSRWPLYSGPTMGCGIWVLHYMVMQAHHHNHIIIYNIRITLASLFVAIAGCCIGFACLLYKKICAKYYLIPALIFSASAATMHYLGMAAIVTMGDWQVSNANIALSLIVIFVTSLIMLRLTHLMLGMTGKNDSYANFYRLGATLTLCAGVAIMHFLGSCNVNMDQMENMGQMTASSMAVNQAGHIENTLATTIIVLVALLFVLATFIWFINFKENLSNERLKNELIQKNLQLKQMTQHDSLTQLPNRFYLQEYLNTQFNNPGAPLSVMFIDLDGFKRVNDVWGHAVGDELLVEISHSMKSVVGEEGFVAHIGGDEFIVVTGEKDRHCVTQLAQRLLSAISGRYELSATTVDFLSASIGISVYPQHGNDVATLLKKADVAIYYIKDKGKNGVTFYDEIAMTLPS